MAVKETTFPTWWGGIKPPTKSGPPQTHRFGFWAFLLSYKKQIDQDAYFEKLEAALSRAGTPARRS